MPTRSVDAEPGACDSGAQFPHPWGGLAPAPGLDDPPWHADPWQDLDADYRRWQQVRYRQFADEFERGSKP